MRFADHACWCTLLAGLLACTSRPERPDSVARLVVQPEPLLPVCEGLDRRDAPAASSYHFSLDGESFLPDIRPGTGGPHGPSEGDVIKVLDMSMLLGPPGVYRYFTDPADPWVLELAVNNGPRTLVRGWLATIPAPSRGQDLSVFRGLRGLLVDGLDTVPTELDVSGMLVEWELDLHTTTKRSTGVPFPPTLRSLRLDVRTSGDVVNDAAELAAAFVALAGYTNLRRLEVEVHQDPMQPQLPLLAVDGGWLASLSGLVSLSLRGSVTALPLAHPRRLSALTRLQALELVRVDPFDLAVVRDLPELRWLVIADAPGVDLSPLSGHPRLVDFHVESRGISAVPDPLPPSLRTLTISSPGLPAELLAELRAQAPGARIQGDWNHMLVEEVTCATKVRILPGCGCWGCACRGCPCSGCVCSASGDARPIEITDPASIRAVLPLMATAPEAVDTVGHGGASTLEFLRGDVLVARIELDLSEAHGGSQHPPLLYWFNAGRSMPRRLLDGNRVALCGWLAGHSAAMVCAQDEVSLQ